jgi:mono/diheme cytochrome c family protein
MRCSFSPAVVVAIALVSSGAIRARGEQNAPGAAVLSGAAIFRTACAACHGTDAKGEGPVADRLRVRPPDLTLLARRNGGSYPDDKVYRIIDGRRPVKDHGGPDLPIWGDAFRSYSDRYSEEEVKEKIRAVVAYLKSIQAPTK